MNPNIDTNADLPEELLVIDPSFMLNDDVEERAPNPYDTEQELYEVLARI